MSILIDDCSAALVAPSRPRAPFAGARLLVDDAQPRFANPVSMPIAAMAWRRTSGSTARGFEAAQQGTQDGRTAFAGAAYVTATKHLSTRSGPPTPRPSA